jgi:hypothetical protein
MPTALRDVRSQGQSGKQMLALSFSGFGPEADILGFLKPSRLPILGVRQGMEVPFDFRVRAALIA